MTHENDLNTQARLKFDTWINEVPKAESSAMGPTYAVWNGYLAGYREASGYPIRAFHDVPLGEPYQLKKPFSEKAASLLSHQVVLDGWVINQGAKIIAKSLDYPFEHMTEQGRDNMRKIASDVLALAAPQPAAQVPDGWKEAAIAWEVCASIHNQWAKGKDALFTTRQSDFVKHAENARAMLAAPQQVSERVDELEPVYMFRRKGLTDFVTCTRERYLELTDSKLFEVKKLYEAAPISQPPSQAVLKEDAPVEPASESYNELGSALKGLIDSLAQLRSGDFVIARDSIPLAIARAALRRAGE